MLVVQIISHKGKGLLIEWSRDGGLVNAKAMTSTGQEVYGLENATPTEFLVWMEELVKKS